MTHFSKREALRLAALAVVGIPAAATDAQIRFTTDASGMVTGAEAIDRGAQMVGRRVGP